MFTSRTRRAFTLLELVVAIVILGILSALAIPTFTALITSSDNAAAKDSVTNVARAAVASAAMSDRAADDSDLSDAATSAGLTATAGVIVVNHNTCTVTFGTDVGGVPGVTCVHA